MLSFRPLIFVNGVQDAPISPLDRGFAYGDGVFETIAMRQGHLALLKWHLQRLNRSCESLNIVLDRNELERQLTQVLLMASNQGILNAVVKLVVTRGPGGRGYVIPEKCETTLCILVVPPPANFLALDTAGINLFLCEQRLGRNARLAGLKHLNKLEYVLARAEWQDDRFSEGLLRDAKEFVVEGTSSNLFIVTNNVLLTPSVKHCGVAGIMRGCIIEHLAPAIDCEVRELELSLDDIERADEVFVCNSVKGIRPAVSLGECQWGVGTLTLNLQQALATFLVANT